MGWGLYDPQFDQEQVQWKLVKIYWMFKCYFDVLLVLIIESSDIFKMRQFSQVSYIQTYFRKIGPICMTNLHDQT